MSVTAPREATVVVPATSANLGPGFDCLGLALGLVDELTASAIPAGPDGPLARVSVRGEGEGEVPDGDDHLVVRTLRAALDALGVPQPTVDLRCRNGVPHGRGLGSSAAATVAGVLLGRALAGAAGRAMDDGAVLALATAFEGHPDNAAPALLGGATVAWCEPAGARAVRIDVHPDVVPLVLVPPGRLATHHARSLLPPTVPHADAAASAGRAALLVHALAHRPDLLVTATADTLHQEHRRPAMPGTLAVVDELRHAGLAAVVSGAGPSVLVLSARDRADADTAVVRRAAAGAWALVAPGVRREPARSS